MAVKNWISRATALLTATMTPPRHELNELDWKAALSPDRKRLTEHLAAFGNHPGGGFLVYGVCNDGTLAGVGADDIERIVNHLTNLGRDAVEPPLLLDHAVESYDGVPLLFLHVLEAAVKPVHLRGRGLDNAFIRTGGSTRKASRQEVGTLMLSSHTPRWEELRTSVFLADAALPEQLDVEPILTLLKRPVPEGEELLQWMAAEGFVQRIPAGGGYITNLGAIAAARELTEFSDLSRKAIRVIRYRGTNKHTMLHEQEGKRGYAVRFQGLLDYVNRELPSTEVIVNGLRNTQRTYPELALREIIANALIHQDFTVSGTGPLIEIFDDRVEISNPGTLLPSKSLDRLIGTQPESRNERLARAFRRYRICEEQGSGLLKAGIEVEIAGLPPMHFEAGPNHFKVTLFGPRPYARMTPSERLDACYQHAVIRFFSGERLTNKSLRERLRMPEKQRSMVSVLIQAAVDEGSIKAADPENRSKKHAEYIPSWA